MEVLISGIDAVGAIASAVAGGLAVGLTVWKVRHAMRTGKNDVENENEESVEA